MAPNISERDLIRLNTFKQSLKNLVRKGVSN